MTKMAATPINVKNLLPQNQKANDLESWYAPSGTQVLPSLFKWCPWVDTDLFYGKIKFIQMMTLSWPWPILRQGQIWSLMLLYGENGETMDFSVTVVVCDIKLVDAVN